MISFNLSFLLKALCPNTVTLGVRASTWEIQEDTVHSIPHTLCLEIPLLGWDSFWALSTLLWYPAAWGMSSEALSTYRARAPLALYPVPNTVLGKQWHPVNAWCMGEGKTKNELEQIYESQIKKNCKSCLLFSLRGLFQLEDSPHWDWDVFVLREEI